MLKHTRTQLERQKPPKVTAPIIVNKRYGAYYGEAKANAYGVAGRNALSQNRMTSLEMMTASSFATEGIISGERLLPVETQ